MKMTKEQERAVQSGQPVHLQREGLDCVVIRTDLYERVATLFESGNPLKQIGASPPDLAGMSGEKRIGSAAGPNQPWTEIDNSRRCDLIDKDIAGTITEAERTELAQLQERFHIYLDETAPPPIEGARQLHRRLLEKRPRRQGEPED